MSAKVVFNGLRFGTLLDDRGTGGETYLTRAVKMGLVDAAEDFLKLGADPNRENAVGEAPIFIALAQRDRAMIAMLVKNGASVFVKKDGLTFREQALKMGLDDVAECAARLEAQRVAFVKAMSMGAKI